MLQLKFNSILLILILSFSFNNIVMGQQNIFHIPPPAPFLGDTAIFQVNTINDFEVVGAFFLYRQYGQQSYNQVEMNYLGDVWEGVILGVEEERGIEYFFHFINKSGSETMLPSIDLGENPYVISVIPLPENDNNKTNSNTNNFLILNPNKNDIIYSNDVLIMVSLYNIPDIDINTIKIHLDDIEITKDVTITSDIITYMPEEVSPGTRVLKLVAYKNNGEIVFHKQSISINKYRRSSLENNFTYSAKGKSVVSLDQLENENLNIYQTDFSLNGRWKNLKFKSEIKITSEESEFKQPKNRFSTVIHSENIKLQIGDFKPLFSKYTIYGKRIRGYGLDLKWKKLRFQSAHGELEREIQGLLTMDQSYSISDIYALNNGKTMYELDRRGYIFKNYMDSYRLSFNINNKFIIGSTLMKAKNEINSVDREISSATFTVPLDTSLNIQQLDSGVYSFMEFHNFIEENNQYTYDLSYKDWGGNKPEQNLIIGSDFKLILDEDKFFMEGYWAISFLNKNIWDGPMTLAGMDTLDSIADGQIFGLVDTSMIPNPSTLADYITINSNLTPLVPIDYNLFNSNPGKAIMNMPSTIYSLKLRSLYFNNFLELQYSQVGPEFYSLANPYLPNNVREISFTDKIWLLNKHLLSTFNYKYKTDDILETNPNPYNETNIGINLNYISGLQNPSILYGYHFTNRKNSITEIEDIDMRVNFITKNNLFNFNIPFHKEKISYWLGGTYNSIISKDQLSDSRSEDFLSSTSNIQLSSIILGAHYKEGLRLSLNLSNLINSHATLGKNILKGLALTGGYPIFKNKIKFSGTLSYLLSTGLSDFASYGLSITSKINISNTFQINLSGSIKARSTSESTDISSSAIRFSTNYIF